MRSAHYAVREKVPVPWLLPVVAETYDGWLSDAASFPVTAEHAFAALDGARRGPVAEGNVGGGTGMICHEFKGGTGTASRVVETAGERFTVGALVQANYGARELLRVDGVPVGREIGPDSRAVASRRAARGRLDHRGAGDRCAAAADPVPAPGATRHDRASPGSAESAPTAAATSSSPSPPATMCATARRSARVRMLSPDSMTPLFQAAAEATEEAILNALTGAETMTGVAGHTAHALPLDRLVEVMRRYGRTAGRVC